jgi:hypothetical protein
MIVDHTLEEVDSDTTLFIKKVCVRELQSPLEKGDSYTLVLDDRGGEDEEDFSITSILSLHPNTAPQVMEIIKTYLSKPVVVTHDGDGRVRVLLLGGCQFMVMSGMWKLGANLLGPDMRNCRSVHDPSTTLACQMITMVEIDENNVIIASDTDQVTGFQNKEGRLLLPHNIKFEVRKKVLSGLGTQVAATYDQYGRVYCLTLNTDIHIILMNYWRVMSRKKIEITINGIDEEDDSLSAIYYQGLKLYIPKGLPLEFREWQPHGSYTVEHDDDQKIYSITREEDATAIHFHKFWDTRYEMIEERFSFAL